uniref:SUEL-type lectin domain-containing protein n=1 Tax=Ciona savignyi TaxID=51511 RepID=H2ZHC8_CIOSA
MMKWLVVMMCFFYVVNARGSVDFCDGSRGEISCPIGKTILVYTAFYGRNNPGTCPGKNTQYNCQANGGDDYVKNACTGQNSCYLSSFDDILGDPCRDTTKYMHVDFECL